MSSGEADLVVVTGLGAVSALGWGIDALWSGVERGEDGLRPVRRFSTEGFKAKYAGLVPGEDGFVEEDEDELVLQELVDRFAAEAANEAWAHAGLRMAAIDGRRVAVVLGTSPVGSARLDRVVRHVGHVMNARGARLTISTACASSTNAIGWARDLLLAGDCDIALAGGADVITPLLFAGFDGLGALAPEKCAPFSQTLGTTLGEGAGFLVLERRASAKARGAKELAAVLGYGLASDAFHETSPDPAGAGVARALDGALRDAQVSPNEVGYANAHGTGTGANDPAEWRGYEIAFGEHAARLPISATKSILGHAQGAAGVLELIVTLLSMSHRAIPPTLRWERPRRGAPPDPVASSSPRSNDFDVAIKSSAAFGGANAALLVARPEVARARDRARRPVYLRGAARVGLDSPVDALPPLGALFRGADPRSIDRTGRLMATASALALRDGELVLRGPLRSRSGLVAAVVQTPRESSKALRQSVRDRGLLGISAPAFARAVPVAPGGTCCRLLSLKGPFSTVSVGDVSDLVALAYAAELLSTQESAEVMLAASVSEDPPGDVLHDGAAAFALALEPPPSSRPIRVAGWSLGPSDELGETEARALQKAGLSAAERCTARDDLANAHGVRWAAALIDALHALREGSVSSALLSAEVAGATSVALVITAGDLNEH